MVVRIEDILAKLDRFGISLVSHSQSSFRAHLKGTHDILESWGCSPQLCLAGLCHSIYGTESFSKAPASLENRAYVQDLIGKEAEQLAYLFGAHIKESLWDNLDRANNYFIEDRFIEESVPVSCQELADLVTLTLANWLEQRPRTNFEFQFLRQVEFLRSKRLLPAKAFQAFTATYGLSNA
jgi:hypothetical protein